MNTLPAQEGTPSPKTPWYCKTSTLVIGFLAVGPLVIPLIWLNPRYSTAKKITLTALMVLITMFLVKILAASLASIQRYYRVIEGNF